MQKRIFSRREAVWEGKLQKVAIGAQTLGTRVVANGVILPVRSCAHKAPGASYMLEGLFAGGVATARYAFVAGQLRNSGKPRTNYSCCKAYRPKGTVAERDERVVFGGVLYGHYGHMLLDGLSRMWWYAQNQDTQLKFVFVTMPGESPRVAKELLGLLGLNEDRYEIIDQPTRFAQVIVPDQAVFSLEGKAYGQWLATFDLIRDRCVASSTIEPRERIYLTRTQLPNNDGVGEEYYERFYASRGYDVIAPETLPLQDQVKLYACAKHIACTMGTLSHAALFAVPGTELTCLLRCGATNMPQLIVNEARGLDWHMFDAFRNVLPTEQGHGAYLYVPTPYFGDYAHACGWDVPPVREGDSDVYHVPDELVASYLRLWLRTYDDPRSFRAIQGKTIFDVLNSLSISFDDVELQRSLYCDKKPGVLARIRHKLAR